MLCVGLLCSCCFLTETRTEGADITARGVVVSFWRPKAAKCECHILFMGCLKRVSQYFGLSLSEGKITVRFLDTIAPLRQKFYLLATTREIELHLLETSLFRRVELTHSLLSPVISKFHNVWNTLFSPN